MQGYAHLIRTARSFVNADLAEDLVQETFLIAQKRLDRVVNSPNPTAWLVKTLRNVIGNTYQKRRFIYTELIPESIVDESGEHVLSVNDMYAGLIDDEALSLLIWIYCEDASYVNSGNGVFIISYSSCATVPPTYYEKTDNLLETFNAGGNTYRILQNVDNYVVVWLTPHFECCISMSADSTDISSLKNIILSMQ